MPMSYFDARHVKHLLHSFELIVNKSKSIAELGDLLKAPKEENLTEEEQKNLQLGLLKLIVVVKEFKA